MKKIVILFLFCLISLNIFSQIVRTDTKTVPYSDTTKFFNKKLYYIKKSKKRKFDISKIHSKSFVKNYIIINSNSYYSSEDNKTIPIKIVEIDKYKWEIQLTVYNFFGTIYLCPTYVDKNIVLFDVFGTKKFGNKKGDIIGYMYTTIFKIE